MKTNAAKCISVVTPCYNEELNVTVCYETIRDIFARELPEYEYEHIFCDNASQDRTPELLANLAANDPRVKVILNANNFGPFRSMFNGLLASSGDAAVVQMVADLQDPPELIVDFVRHWEAGYDIVHGVRAQREEGFVMRKVRGLYYRLVRGLASIDVPVNVSEFQLIDRAVVNALREFDDYYPYIRGMIAYCGFRSIGIAHTWKARERGFSKNRLYHLVDQALNGIISLTNLPMRACLLLGSVVAAFSMLYAVVSLAVNLLYFQQMAPPGVPTLIVAVFFFSGLNLFFLGVLGEYISAIHFQVRRRPSVVERARLNFADDQPQRSNTTIAYAHSDRRHSAPAPLGSANVRNRLTPDSTGSDPATVRASA